MDLQDDIFLQYLRFVKETESDPEVRKEKWAKACDDYLFGKERRT
jgi:hypothetical protein